MFNTRNLMDGRCSVVNVGPSTTEQDVTTGCRQEDLLQCKWLLPPSTHSHCAAATTCRLLAHLDTVTVCHTLTQQAVIRPCPCLRHSLQYCFWSILKASKQQQQPPQRHHHHTYTPLPPRHMYQKATNNQKLTFCKLSCHWFSLNRHENHKDICK